MGIYAVIQIRNPRGDSDFCFAGCHGQTHAAKVTAGRRVRQIVVQIFSDLRKIRCRDIGFSGFRCGGFGCLRRGRGILCKSGQRCAQICERNPTRQQQRQALLYSVFVLHTNFSFCCKRKSPLRVAAGLVSVRERVSWDRARFWPCRLFCIFRQHHRTAAERYRHPDIPAKQPHCSGC